MASTQQRQKQAHRSSTGGRDILSRMLLMERQNKEKRASSASPTSQTDSQFRHFDGPFTEAYPKSPRESLPPRPALSPRSQTLPLLLEARSPAKAVPIKESLKIDIVEGKGDRPPDEICLSPSWSDHGEKKRRREKKQREREQKEFDKKAKEHDGRSREVRKRARQEEEREKQHAADLKAGKRLSKKPPPAAMETQKMPSGLRRHSLVSIFTSSRPSSREGSRPNSQAGGDKRLSGISFSSFTSGRSRSTPATSDEPADSIEQPRSTVSPTAPRLPSFSWKTRNDSNETSKSATWDSEDAYDKEVVEFAYRLDASAFIAESERIEKKRSQSQQQPRKSHFKEHTEINGFNRSATEPILTGAQQVSTVPQSPPKSPKRPKPQQQQSSEPRVPQRGNFENFWGNHNSKVTSSGAPNGVLPNRAANERQSKSPEVSSPQERPWIQMRSSHDGSSYVHKQRMYQQQMSIAGFEDQQAVQLANELAAQNEYAQETQSHAASTPNGSRSSTPIEQGATTRAHQDDRGDSQETIVSRSSDGRARRDISPHSKNLAFKQPQKPTPLSQSTKPVEILDKPSLDMSGGGSANAQESVALNKTSAPPAFKSDKILSFRKRTKPPPARIWVPENDKTSTSHQPPMSAPSSQPVEPASKRSRMEKMFIDPLAAQIPFRKRADSAGSANLKAPLKFDGKEAIRGHSRNRTNSSEALTEDLPSPMPRSKPMEVPKPKASKANGQPSPTAKEYKPAPGKTPNNDTGSEKPRSQSSGGLLETASKTTKETPSIPSTVSDDDSQQPLPVAMEQKPAGATELTRYALVETVKPRDASTMASPTIEAESRTFSGPISNPPTEKKPNVAALTETPKADLEVVVESMNSEGLIRKTSITRPRSNPQLQTQTTVTNSLPSLDFLPQLKHQPLVKKTSPLRTSVDSTVSQFPGPSLGSLGSLSSSPANSRLLASAVETPVVMPRSPLRPPAPFATSNSSRKQSPPATPPVFNRSSTSIPSASTTTLSRDTDIAGVAAKPVAKLFVICCKCKFWHDLPSKLYEAMALPKELHHIKEEDGREDGKENGKAVGEKSGEEKGKKVAQLDTAVKCPWCEHAMTTWCCQGWTTVVYLHQRHH